MKKIKLLRRADEHQNGGVKSIKFNGMSARQFILSCQALGATFEVVDNKLRCRGLSQAMRNYLMDGDNGLEVQCCLDLGADYDDTPLNELCRDGLAYLNHLKQMK